MHYDKNNLEYIVVRLSSTIINTVEGEPFYIETICPDATVHGHYLKDIDETLEEVNQSVYLDLDQIDLLPVKLGNMNYNKRCYWLSRTPIRDWKQGLSSRNIQGWKGSIYNIKALYYTIKGIYPSFEEVQADIGRDWGSKAFSRNFSLSYPNFLQYKGKIVGTVVRGDVEWLSGKSYLNERFLKAVSK